MTSKQTFMDTHSPNQPAGAQTGDKELTPADQLIALLSLKPSDEDLVVGVNHIYNTVGEGVTDADKIAAYDKIAEALGNIWGNNDEATDGTIYEDSDNSHYLYEIVTKAMMGGNIFDVKNKIFESC